MQRVFLSTLKMSGSLSLYLCVSLLYVSRSIQYVSHSSIFGRILFKRARRREGGERNRIVHAIIDEGRRVPCAVIADTQTWRIESSCRLIHHSIRVADATPNMKKDEKPFFTSSSSHQCRSWSVSPARTPPPPSSSSSLSVPFSCVPTVATLNMYFHLLRSIAMFFEWATKCLYYHSLGLGSKAAQRYLWWASCLIYAHRLPTTLKLSAVTPSVTDDSVSFSDRSSILPTSVAFTHLSPYRLTGCLPRTISNHEAYHACYDSRITYQCLITEPWSLAFFMRSVQTSSLPNQIGRKIFGHTKEWKV